MLVNEMINGKQNKPGNLIYLTLYWDLIIMLLLIQVEKG